jgi:hypothetical protein
MPELGEGSPEIVILHVDFRTQVTQLMIRVTLATYTDETHEWSAPAMISIACRTFILPSHAG